MAIAPLLYVPIGKFSSFNSESILTIDLVLGLLFNLAALFIISTKSRKDITEYRKLLTLF